AEMEALTGDERIQKYMSNQAQSCATSVYGAVSSELEGKGGLYLEGASVSERLCPPGADAVEYGYADYAFDQAKEEELWELSKKMTKVE
ncbi:MAG: hypothetical protein Q9198_003297, partial [Flavoplaca austrocitrina]